MGTSPVVTFAKLRDGSWGLRSTSTLTPGCTYVVTRKSGSKAKLVCGSLVAKGDGWALHRIGVEAKPVASDAEAHIIYSAAAEAEEAGFY